MDDEQKYYLAYVNLNGDVTMSDGQPVEMDRWYHITVIYGEPNWWQRLKRRLGRR